jgi:hypothetical protein
MAATCFCGCGRRITGIRPRANNAVAGKMSEHLAVLRGALGHDEAGGRTAEVSALAHEGTRLIGDIARYLHGEITRADLDRAAVKAWLGKGGEVARSLVASTSGPSWEPDDRRTAELALTGTRAPGVVTDVDSAGYGNTHIAAVDLTVTVRTANGTLQQLRRKLTIAVTKAPRVGDRVEVAYDAADPNRFVYRPRVELP